MTASDHTPHPESVDYEAVGTEERELPPPSAVEAIVTEFLETVPEVRDALLAAADSLLDAARAIVDAADRVLHRSEDEPESGA